MQPLPIIDAGLFFFSSMTCDASNLCWLHDHDTHVCFKKLNLDDANVDLTVGFAELDSSNQ